MSDWRNMGFDSETIVDILRPRASALSATIFWRFGIDPGAEIHDLTHRPFKVAEGQPLRRLFARSV